MWFKLTHAERGQGAWGSPPELTMSVGVVCTAQWAEHIERGREEGEGGKKIQLENLVIKLLEELAEQHFGLFDSLQTD